jgi:hypothetical protein
MKSSGRGRRVRSTTLIAVTVSVMASGMSGASASASATAAADAARARHVKAFARRQGRAARHTEMASARRAAATVVGVYQAADAAGDTYPVTDARADVQPWAVFYTKTEFVFALKTAVQTDPFNDPVWDPGSSGIVWGIDSNGDGQDDFAVFYERDAVTHALTATLHEVTNFTELCAGHVAAGWSVNSGYTVTFAPKCLGGTGPVRVGASVLIDLDPNGTSGAATVDNAPDKGYSPWITPSAPPPPPPPPTRAATANGWTLDGWGGLHPFSTDTVPAVVTGAPYWVGWNIARGVAATSVTSGWGAVADGWGGLHLFTVGAGAAPVMHTTGYWPGWDIARGVAMLPNGSGGFVLDGFGGLHPFSTGVNSQPQATGMSYWPGWDIARNITINPAGTGGYVVDAWGGLHPFAIGANPAPPAAVLATYWADSDVARGVSVLVDGTGGYTLDGTGELHGFDIGSGTAVPAPPANAASWPMWDIARGVAVAGP